MIFKNNTSTCVSPQPHKTRTSGMAEEKPLRGEGNQEDSWKWEKGLFEEGVAGCIEYSGTLETSQSKTSHLLIQRFSGSYAWFNFPLLPSLRFWIILSLNLCFVGHGTGEQRRTHNMGVPSHFFWPHVLAMFINAPGAQDSGGPRMHGSSVTLQVSSRCHMSMSESHRRGECW